MFKYKTIIFDLIGVLVKGNQLYDGIKSLLKLLVEDEYILCICTDKGNEYVDYILNKYKINEYFIIIKSGSQVYTKAQCIKQILDETSSCSAIVIGKEDVDIEAANNVSCKYIGTYYGKLLNSLECNGLKAYLPSDIYDIIKEINNAYESSTEKSFKEDNIFLNPVESKHIEDINLMLQENEARKMLGVTTFPDEAYYKDSINRCYAIAGTSGEFIGIVELFNISWKNRRAELSICIRSAYRGNGFAYNAINKVLNLAFEEIGLNRVWLRVLEYNYKAINLYQKVGFIKEGVCRAESLREGKFTNQVQMSILRDEWPNLDRTRGIKRKEDVCATRK